MARFYWDGNVPAVLFEADHNEELSLDIVNAAAASDLGWAMRKVAEALQGIEHQLERIADRLPSEGS